MKIEIYYIEKDDDFRKSYKTIKETVQEFKKTVSFKLLEIQLIQVEKGKEQEYRFYGHVSARINGEDLENRNDKNYSFGQREYSSDNGKTASIPKPTIKKAIQEYIDGVIEVQKMKGNDTPEQIC